MGWLVSYTLASIVAAFLVVKIFDYVFAEVSGSLVNIARFGLFVGTWTAVTAKGGMGGFSKRIRVLRQGSANATARIEALTKGK